MREHEERRADRLVRVYTRLMRRRIPQECGHAERVTALAERIGAAMGFTTIAMCRLRRAGLLHDVGKLNVRPAVLTKPSRLNDAEYAEMRRHSAYGALWLLPAPALLPSMDAVLCHHERWDGTGYPLRLAGRAIPLMARILAVADVFDALTSDRVYRPALPAGEALAIITEGAGTLFDPAIVALLLRTVVGFSHAVVSLQK